MGVIAFYLNPVSDANRVLGTRKSGALLKTKLISEPNFKRAIVATLDTLILEGPEDNRTNIVRYEWEKSDGTPKNWRLHTLDSGGNPIYHLKNMAGDHRGYLNLDIDKDQKHNRVFDMSIVVPRRGENPNSWDYFTRLLGDIGSGDTDDNNNYLRAALTFSRCK